MTSALIGGRYELLETIGEGGFAVTWRAWDTRLERAVALKILRPQYARDERFVFRFVREARAAASVSHPNVVRLYDFGQDPDIVFIAMQYVQGQTLRDLLRRFPGGMPESDVIKVIAPVLRGLSAVHEAGIVHRDVKPDNVLIDRDGEVLITDFGIALLADSPRLTEASSTFGTAAYMAPEQGRGDPVTPATDIYAIGVVLFELLTGRLPFIADNPVAMMMAHQNQSPPFPSQYVPGGVSPSVQSATMRALAKRPEDRFPSAEAFLDALTGRTIAATIQARPVTATMPMAAAPRLRATPSPQLAAPPVTRRRSSPLPWLLLLVLIAGCAALGAAYAAGYFDTSEDPAQRPVVVTSTPTPPREDTPTTIDAPTIAPVEDVPTEVIETPTEIIETPTEDTGPGMIESAVPDSSPQGGIESNGP
jgi:serine/threonine-protein kinase